MGIDERFYKDRVVLNVLANSVENARELYEATEGHVLIGVLSKDYSSVEEAVTRMKEYGKSIEDAVSIGLGSGDSNQSAMVAEIAKYYPGSHINQVFPKVGITRANLGTKDSWINALVSPTGRAGFVNISTGPLSGKIEHQAIIPVKSAIALVKDMGGHALKYFPMKGLQHSDEYRIVAKACGEEGFALEPTGGITLENYETILSIALAAKVPKIIPHVYSSIIDKKTGKTNSEDIVKLFDLTKRLVKYYE